MRTTIIRIVVAVFKLSLSLKILFTINVTAGRKLQKNSFSSNPIFQKHPAREDSIAGK
jgi:hypothetical protein